MSLVDALPTDPDADSIYVAFTAWVSDQGLVLYPHQEEAVIELFSDHNVVLGTTTGSGRSMVAVAAHFAALAEGRTTYYTAPIKALVSEEFFVRRTAAVGVDDWPCQAEKPSFAAVLRMARPGLEPGTPRFSVVCSTN